MKIPRADDLTPGAQRLAENLGVRLLGRVLVDPVRDGLRLRLRLPDDPPNAYRVAFVAASDCDSPEGCVHAMANAIEDVVARAAEERSATQPWSPYPS